MLSYSTTIKLAGKPIMVETRYPYPVFEPYRTEERPQARVWLSDERMTRAEKLFPRETDAAEIEFTILAYQVSNQLLTHRQCVFHGVAFYWNRKAWIFTARSGTGKTTQYAMWKCRYGSEITMMNGDKPILEWREDGSIWVCPSPWCGKEQMGTDKNAMLGGIILLEQQTENAIEELTPEQAAVPLIRQMLFDADSPDTVNHAFDLLEDLVLHVPVWKLKNRGDMASAELAHDVLSKWEDSHGH